MNLTDKQAEAVDAVALHGSQVKAAKALGITRASLQKRLAGAEYKMNLDPAIHASMVAVGTDMVPALAWAKVPSKDGEPGYSVLLKPQAERAETVEEMADRIAERMNRVLAAPTIIRPQTPRSDLMNFSPWFDVHMGMRVGSYGTAEAVARLQEGARDVMDRAPMAETLIIVNGGDFTEANDNAALTPQNRHPLAVDMDFDDISDVAVDTTISLIEHALTRAERVIYQPLKANHDPAMSVILRQALRQRYRDNPRFELRDGFTMFAHEWQGNFVAAIHGDQKVTKPGELTLAIASRHAAAWGVTRHRELWRGHNHKELTIAVPGMTVFQVNPICPPGRYANDNLFTGQSDIQCITYGAGGGRKATTVHIF